MTQCTSAFMSIFVSETYNWFVILRGKYGLKNSDKYLWSYGSYGSSSMIEYQAGHISISWGVL